MSRNMIERDLCEALAAIYYQGYTLKDIERIWSVIHRNAMRDDYGPGYEKEHGPYEEVR